MNKATLINRLKSGEVVKVYFTTRGHIRRSIGGDVVSQALLDSVIADKVVIGKRIFENGNLHETIIRWK